jgi:hypothetical protein
VGAPNTTYGGITFVYQRSYFPNNDTYGSFKYLRYLLEPNFAGEDYSSFGSTVVVSGDGNRGEDPRS